MRSLANFLKNVTLALSDTGDVLFLGIGHEFAPHGLNGLYSFSHACLRENDVKGQVFASAISNFAETLRKAESV